MLKDLDITPGDPEELRAVNRLLADEVKSQALMIETAKLNDVDPQAWLTWGLAQIADHKITRLHEPLPWRYAA